MNLTEITQKYGSDKASSIHNQHHNYTKIYEKLFEPIRREKINLLEIGIGSTNPSVPHNMSGCKNYTSGASLRGWKEYFENGNIYGCDIDEKTFFNEDRLECFYLNQTSDESLNNLLNREEKYDIIIDDGLHDFPVNWSVLKSIYSKLKPTGIYIIEDIFNYVQGIEYEKFCKNKIVKYVSEPIEKNKVDNNILIVTSNMDYKNIIEEL